MTNILDRHLYPLPKSQLKPNHTQNENIYILLGLLPKNILPNIFFIKLLILYDGLELTQ